MCDSTKRRRPSLHPLNHEGHEQEAAEGEAVQERNVGTEEELEADANEGVEDGELADAHAVEDGELADARAEASSVQVDLIHGHDATCKTISSTASTIASYRKPTSAMGVDEGRTRGALHPGLSRHGLSRHGLSQIG